MWHWPGQLLRAQAAVGFVVRRKRRARGGGGDEEDDDDDAGMEL